MVTFPLIYKKIPTQYVFMVDDDGTLSIQIVTDIPRTIKFNSPKEAREYIKNYKYQL